MDTPAPVFPRALFDQYQESKADLVSSAMNLAHALRTQRGGSIEYWHDQILRISADIESLRAAILRDPLAEEVSGP